MRITVDVKPKAKKDNVELIAENHYMVHTRAPASKGKANVAVTKLLKKHIGKENAFVIKIHIQRAHTELRTRPLRLKAQRNPFLRLNLENKSIGRHITKTG